MPITNGVSDATCVCDKTKKMSAEVLFFFAPLFFYFPPLVEEKCNFCAPLFSKKVETFTKGMAASELSLVGYLWVRIVGTEKACAEPV